MNRDIIIGNWQGFLNLGSSKLGVTFIITRGTTGKLTASLLSPSQGGKVEANNVTFNTEQLQVEINSIGGKYDGIYEPSSQKIKGKWYQRGQTFDLILEQKDEIVEVKRPQEPRKPYPYIEELVTYENAEADIILAGTLTYPKDNSPFPATILISGSGAQDRNERIFGHKPFLVLTDYLTRRGIAVLRVDDRGVGGSSGNYLESTNFDFAGDVISGINYLKSREEIDPKKIGLIGHSEGGVIAPIVANISPDVAFIVLMAGPGIPLEDILYKQAELIGRGENLSKDLLAKERSLQEKMFSIIKEESDNISAKSKLEKVISETVKDMKTESIPIFQGNIEAQINYMLSPWFRDFLAYNPKKVLRHLKCPVLALNGEKDLQVPSDENVSAIERELKLSDNKNYKVIQLPNLNHLFQTSHTGALSEYANIEETISPIALKLIGDWILEQVIEYAIQKSR